MSVESIPKGEATITGRALVISLLEVSNSIMFVCVSTFCKGLVTDLASKGLDSVGGSDMRG